MRHSIRIAVLFSLLCLFRTSLFAQQVLTITFQETNLVLTATQFAALPHTEIKVTDPHEKKEHQYSVVPVHDLLAQVGVPMGDKLRGSALHYVVMVRARDGYAVAFTLADFDEAYTDRTIFLADREDGNPLSETTGPLRLIIPDDKKASRWARMVTKIEVFDVDHK
jgi:hypothetical protein